SYGDWSSDVCSSDLQLLQSDQKLELGGHSQFLTVFFSDLEAFSTLSEAVPAQDLLLRVSAYLELVTKAVNDEAGTIDKFIGDGEIGRAACREGRGVG